MKKQGHKMLGLPGKESGKSEKRRLTGRFFIQYNTICAFVNQRTINDDRARSFSGRCGRRPPCKRGAPPDRIQEVFQHEAYLSAQETPAQQGSWLPQADGHRQRPQSSLPPPSRRSLPPVLLRWALKSNRVFCLGRWSFFCRPRGA